MMIKKYTLRYASGQNLVVHSEDAQLSSLIAQLIHKDTRLFYNKLAQHDDNVVLVTSVMPEVLTDSRALVC